MTTDDEYAPFTVDGIRYMRPGQGDFTSRPMVQVIADHTDDGTNPCRCEQADTVDRRYWFGGAR